MLEKITEIKCTMQGGGVVREYEVEVEPEPVVEPEPSEREDMASMVVDHEYRLTLLELGVM